MMLIVLLSVVPAALSHGWHHGGMGGEGRRMGHMIQRIDMPITVTGTKDNTASFIVKNVAMVGHKDMAGVVTFDKPVKGAYNMTDNMAYMTNAGATGMNIRVDDMNTSALPVAGSAGIMSMGNISVLYKGKDYAIMQFGKVSFHLPDGTVKSYDLDKPVKIVKSYERKSGVMDASPGFTNAIKDVFSGGKTFPADAPPMKVSDLMKTEAGKTAVRIADTTATAT
jgi:hypothetical protein